MSHTLVGHDRLVVKVREGDMHNGEYFVFSL